MLPDRVSNPGPLTYESGALPIALRGPWATCKVNEPHSVHVNFASDSSINIRKIKFSTYIRFYQF